MVSIVISLINLRVLTLLRIAVSHAATTAATALNGSQDAIDVGRAAPFLMR